MKYKLNQIYNEDCLEAMKQIPDKSIDLILTDPPYNIGIDKWDKWETTEKYIEWCGLWIKECERVLRENGSFYFWHNDYLQASKLIDWIDKNTEFIFNSFIIWDKEDFRALSWKNPNKENKLRSWFNTTEFCVAFTLQSVNGGRKYKENIVYSIREYIRDAIIKKDGKINLKKINTILGTATNGGGVASAILSLDKKEPLMISEPHYKILQKEYKDLQKEYKDLQKEYKDLQKEYKDLRYKFNLSKNHNNVWRSFYKNSGKYHICEKPADLLQKIISCSSNYDDIILDLFAGSGSTCIEAYKLKRKFIAFELDKKNYMVAKKRIDEIKSQITIFDFEVKEYIKQESLF